MELITSYYNKQGDRNLPVSDIDKVILGYIKSFGTEYCDEVIEIDPRPEMGALSSTKKSAVMWYPFRENAVILEVGGDLGQITGALCDKASQVVSVEPSIFRAKVIGERYKNRSNLTVYAGNAYHDSGRRQRPAGTVQRPGVFRKRQVGKYQAGGGNGKASE